jgi:hypothetical protein
VATVRSNAKGKFEAATAVIDVAGTPQEVWRSATAFADYRYFMPKVVKSECQSLSATQADVKFEVEAPLSNSKYVFH